MGRRRTWQRRALTLAAVALVKLGAAGLAGPVLAADEHAPAERLRHVDPAELSYTFAVGSFTPEYTPPPPGSYTLPSIKVVTDHAVVGADGASATLFALKRDRVALV